MYNVNVRNAMLTAREGKINMQNKKMIQFGYKNGSVVVVLKPVMEENVALSTGSELPQEDIEKKAKLTLDEMVKADKASLMIDSAVCGRKAAEKYCNDKFVDGDIVDVSGVDEKNKNERLVELMNDPVLADHNGRFECFFGCVVADCNEE